MYIEFIFNMSANTSSKKRTQYITSYFDKVDKSERFAEHFNHRNKLYKNDTFISPFEPTYDMPIKKINMDDAVLYNSNIYGMNYMGDVANNALPTDIKIKSIDIIDSKDASIETEIDTLRKLLNDTTCNGSDNSDNENDDNNSCDENDYIGMENRCISCNIDMGKMNPRQYCGKTHCTNINLFE